MPTKDIGVALRSVGLRLTNEQVSMLQGKADKEFAEGKFNFKGFTDYIFEGQQIQKTDAELEAAFKVFDAGEDGLIDLDAFRHALSTLGDKMSLEEIDDIIKEARKEFGDDAPGTIDARKLIQLIRSVQ